MNMEGNVVMRMMTLAVTLAAAVMSTGTVANSHADNWLEDPTTGCAVWSDGDAVIRQLAASMMPIDEIPCRGKIINRLVR
jgi:hypothetical protein